MPAIRFEGSNAEVGLKEEKHAREYTGLEKD